MGNTLGLRIPKGLCARHGHRVHWWSHKKILPPNIYLLGRLSRKVSALLVPRARHRYLFLSSKRVLLASIRDKGRCPCPRCLMPLHKVHNLGTAADMRQRQSLARVDNQDRRNKVKTARSIIYEQNYAVNNDASEAILKAESFVATKVRYRTLFCSRQCWLLFNQNAFSEKLSSYGFNLFPMLVVDLMHEFELGVWKALFIHLIRILNAENPIQVHTLDHRCVHICPITFIQN